MNTISWYENLASACGRALPDKIFWWTAISMSGSSTLIVIFREHQIWRGTCFLFLAFSMTTFWTKTKNARRRNLGPLSIEMHSEIEPWCSNPFKRRSSRFSLYFNIFLLFLLMFISKVRMSLAFQKNTENLDQLIIWRGKKCGALKTCITRTNYDIIC